MLVLGACIAQDLATLDAARRGSELATSRTGLLGLHRRPVAVRAQQGPGGTPALDALDLVASGTASALGALAAGGAYGGPSFGPNRSRALLAAKTARFCPATVPVAGSAYGAERRSHLGLLDLLADATRDWFPAPLLATDAYGASILGASMDEPALRADRARLPGSIVPVEAPLADRPIASPVVQARHAPTGGTGRMGPASAPTYVTQRLALFCPAGNHRDPPAPAASHPTIVSRAWATNGGAEVRSLGNGRLLGAHAALLHQHLSRITSMAHRFARRSVGDRGAPRATHGAHVTWLQQLAVTRVARVASCTLPGVDREPDFAAFFANTFHMLMIPRFSAPTGPTPARKPDLEEASMNDTLLEQEPSQTTWPCARRCSPPHGVGKPTVGRGGARDGGFHRASLSTIRRWQPSVS